MEIFDLVPDPVRDRGAFGPEHEKHIGFLQALLQAGFPAHPRFDGPVVEEYTMPERLQHQTEPRHTAAVAAAVGNEDLSCGVCGHDHLRQPNAGLRFQYRPVLDADDLHVRASSQDSQRFRRL
jgi:hypothetical protein